MPKLKDNDESKVELNPEGFADYGDYLAAKAKKPLEEPKEEAEKADE
ncbi:MAG TPA: hypothetical protein VJ327_00220 [Patescibacteria group bacterium]|nr:hypothetical protein [Patescibacteria group bacterium]